MSQAFCAGYTGQPGGGPPLLELLEPEAPLELLLELLEPEAPLELLLELLEPEAPLELLVLEPPLELLVLEPPLEPPLEPELPGPPSPGPSSVRPPHACRASPLQSTTPTRKPSRAGKRRMPRHGANGVPRGSRLEKPALPSPPGVDVSHRGRGCHAAHTGGAGGEDRQGQGDPGSPSHDGARSKGADHRSDPARGHRAGDCVSAGSGTGGRACGDSGDGRDEVLVTPARRSVR